jgi:membrane protein implicated in regulation of membrane protease activity
MTHAFADFNGFEIFFLLCAVVGGFFVLVRLVLQFLGADTHVDGDLDVDMNIDAHHADSDVGFKLLSVHGLTSFLMMFGLVGLALYRQSKVGFLGSLIGACLAGLASVWVIGRLFALFNRLQSSGTLPTSQAVGCTGTVYLNIPAGGTGRVTINFHNRLREFDAVARDGGGELLTGTPIKVVQVHSNVLVVEKLSE